ncbi:LacI family DNA-binding transcriptional regulator [Fusobacterium gastrosuis]|uniref:LacI family DNA-binding transcriptional regulator n=1 Tax=Fusobacterium gastrosuis TaxID=1755100 RepID=UPI0025FD243D|nr:LacI family DNA-binding transcriptional regulator [uncultured Fusobacterium sp.]MDY5305547.1 LacI family DNA-binding transcriptional regulator [Fusobacterium gastrosuis]
MDSKLIAKLAGVSRSTVSKVLNNYSDISEGTRKKVLRVIEDNEYYPNFSAQKLAGKNSPVIGLLVYTGKSSKNGDLPKKISESFYYSDLISEIIDTAENLGYLVLVSYISSKRANWKKVFETGMIDAAIVISGGKKINEIEDLVKSKYKLVLIDYEEEIATKYILTMNSNHFKGGYLATKYLIEKGCKNILHLSGEIKRRTSIQRARGYLKALEDFNLANKEIIFGKYDEEVAYELIEKNIQKKGKFIYDAVFAGNDYIAYGVIKALEKTGLKIPEQVSIIGYDNMKICDYTSPKITSINHLGNNIAEKALKNLIDILNNKEGGIKETDVEIVKRESVKK